MSQLKQIYDKSLTLKEFGTDDFLDITTDKHRLGGLLYILVRKGLIKSVTRGRYVLTNSNVSVTSKNKKVSQSNNKYNILYGLELEFEYNKTKLGNIEKSRYHSEDSENFNKYFIAESDGSLTRNTFMYEDSDTVELVSIPMTSQNVLKSLQSLKDDIQKRYKKHTGKESCELNEVIAFNNTTGAHIHMSLLVKNDVDTIIKLRDDKNVTLKGKSQDIKTFSNIKFMKVIAKKLKTRIKQELPEFYESFIKYYFRKYAKRMTTKTNRSDRYKEFNFESAKTVEYRSLHLRGIKTWEQLFKFYSIVTSLVDTEFNKQFIQDKPFVTEEDFNVEIEIEDTEKVDVEQTIEEEQHEQTEYNEVI